MAINWTTYSATGNIESTETTHQGLVVGGKYVREERVMSDVYANVSYCTVWNPESKTMESIVLGYHFECGRKFGEATVDASPEILAELARRAEVAEADRIAREAAQAEARRLAAIEAEANRPVHGKTMKVVKGRKVAKGTVGKVFWIRDGRVGLALDDSRDARGYHTNVAWVDASYLVAA